MLARLPSLSVVSCQSLSHWGQWVSWESLQYASTLTLILRRIAAQLKTFGSPAVYPHLPELRLSRRLQPCSAILHHAAPRLWPTHIHGRSPAKNEYAPLHSCYKGALPGTSKIIWSYGTQCTGQCTASAWDRDRGQVTGSEQAQGQGAGPQSTTFTFTVISFSTHICMPGWLGMVWSVARRSIHSINAFQESLRALPLRALRPLPG